MEKIGKRPISEQTIEELHRFALKFIDDPDKAKSIVNDIVPMIIDYNATRSIETKVKLKTQALAFLRTRIINKTKE